MKIAAVLMITAGAFFLWVAFQIQFLRRRPLALKASALSSDPGRRYGDFALYYLACAVAAFYFFVLLYRESSPTANMVAIPAICATMALWRKILFKRHSQAT